MHELLNYLQQIVQSLQTNLPLLLLLLACTWVIQLINYATHYRLNRLGIIPRTLMGIPGIVLSPLLHGNTLHLSINSLLFLVLATLVAVRGWVDFVDISIIIIILGGCLTWLFARRAIHIGASGLIMGYWGYLLTTAYHQPNAINIVIGIVCIYYLGYLFINLFPGGKKVSWEGHVFGFVSGIAASYLYPLLMH